MLGHSCICIASIDQRFYQPGKKEKESNNKILLELNLQQMTTQVYLKLKNINIIQYLKEEEKKVKKNF